MQFGFGVSREVNVSDRTIDNLRLGGFGFLLQTFGESNLTKTTPSDLWVRCRRLELRFLI